jgi:PAS domain S-box-containing protein
VVENELNNIKIEITNRVISLSVIFLFFPLIASLSRWFEFGWQNIFITHIVLYISILTIFFLRKVLSLNIKVILLIILYSIIGFAGLKSYAFSGVYFFIIISIALISILLEKKLGFIILAIIMFIFAFIAWGYISGTLSSEVDFNDFSRSISQWITLSISLITFIFIFILGFRRFYTELIKSIEEKTIIGNKLKAQNEELVHLRKTAEETAERFKKLIQHMPSGIATYEAIEDGKDFIFLDINNEAERITNTKHGELIGRRLLEEFPHMHKSPLLGTLQEVYHKGKDMYIPPFYYEDEKRKGWRENYIYKLQSGEIVAVFRDVTDTIQTEQKLKKQNIELRRAKKISEETENRLMTFINSIPDIVCFKDGKGRWLLANDADLKLFHLEGVDYLGKTDAELAKLTEDVFSNAFMHCIETDEKAWQKKILSREIETVTQENGTKTVFDVYKIPIFTPNGKRKGLAVIGRDITKQKLTEEKLIKAKEAAEKSDQLKTAFLNNMSHEIRTPMNGIIGFSKLLMTKEHDRDDHKKYTEIIINSSQQLLQLVNDILDIAKIEANEVKLKEEEIDLNAFCKEIITLYKIEADKKGIDLQVDKSKLKNTKIIVDPTKLRQVMNNLVNNALKFTDKGSITLSCSMHDNDLNFSIADTGIGIAKDMHNRVFDRFRQVETNTEKNYGGTGLGLAICKGLIKLMHGRIWLESEPGIGSTFHFTIPYKTANPNNNNAMREEAMNDLKKLHYKKIQILIVEDEEINYLFLSELLSQIQADLLHAKNGKEAIDMVEKNPHIDIILMDIKMPIMNGYDSTIEIKKIRPDIPVVAISAHAFVEDREKAIQAGCNDFVTKPIDEKELFACIEKHYKKSLK